jgi:four helix bundle protein
VLTAKPRELSERTANTEEAKAAYSRREFASKNSIVLRECHEARYWLRIIAATGVAAKETVTPLLQEANELVGVFTATVRKARQPKESKNLEVKT